MNYIAYTAIFGGKDKVENFIWYDSPSKFICFTDDEEAINDSITIVRVPPFNANSNLSAKLYKLFPHLFLKEYEFSIWFDGNMRIKDTCNPETLIENSLKDNDLALYAHPQRDCIYEEAAACIHDKLDLVPVLETQIQTYKKNNLPRHTGMGACGFLLRRHASRSLINLSNLWWKEILKFSVRDQISFNYLVWRLQYAYFTIPGYYFNNENYQRFGHQKERYTTSTDYFQLRNNESSAAIGLPFGIK